MAGNGPAPKPASKRARRNKDQVETKVLPAVGVIEQPPLPDSIAWHPRTVEWWEAWGRAPQALGGMFADSDWSFLMDTALIHHEVWTNGDLRLMPELRLREAKFGVTMEDRLRLRITFADAEVAESRVERERHRLTARERRASANVIDVTPEDIESEDA